jgi:hypothetical protein
MTQGEEPGLARLLRAVSTVRVPDAVRAAFEADPGDPLPGQLWRARWDEVVELVLLLEVGDGDVFAAPISLDDRCADEDTVILQSTQTSLTTTVAVWMGLAQRLPLYVLDRRLGISRVDVTDRDWVAHAIDARARAADALGFLADATWAPSGTGELGRMLASASLDPQALIELLDVSPQIALALRRGQLAATPDQAAKLAPLLQLPEQVVLEANPAP